MPEYGFGRCDGHHEMVDFRREKKRLALCFTSPIDARCKKESPGRAGAFKGA
jgi:hypothetical protein